MAQPFLEFGERLGAQVVHPKLPVLAHLYQTGITQDSQVSRDAGPSDGQQLRQLTDRGPSCAWQAHDRNAEKRVTTE